MIIEPLGENALLLRLGERIDLELNRRVHALCAALGKAAPAAVVDIVPAYASVAVHFRAERDGDTTGVRAQLLDWLRQHAQLGAAPGTRTARSVEIPVCYGGRFGPDLPALAAHAGLAQDEVVELHCAGDYTVAMLGFAPGFPYMLGLDARLAMPRRGTARTRVAAGSVAIGGAQTGVYPQSSPGGWQLIGRTPLCLFDADREPPTLLAPGDSVRFRAVAVKEYLARGGADDDAVQSA